MGRPAPPEPGDLAVRLRAGEDVLGEWYRRELPVVTRLCLGFLASRSEADDAAQDAMLHLVDKLDQWDPRRAYAAWRSQVILNLCRDRERAGRRRREHEEAAAALVGTPSLPDPTDVAGTRELADLVAACLARMPRREREVFVLVDLEGTSPSDAASLLGIAGSTVRAALTLARRRVRGALSPHLPEYGGPA